MDLKGLPRSLFNGRTSVCYMVRLVKWFAALLGIFALSRLFAYLWTESILKFLIVMSAIGFLLGWVVWNRYRETRRGFWVRYVSPNILRADPDDFAIEYHRGRKEFDAVRQTIRAVKAAGYDSGDARMGNKDARMGERQKGRDPRKN